VLKKGRVSLKEFSSCTFIKCSFNETIFQDCRFRDCTFKGCDLSLVSLKGCLFTNTRFENSQVIGVNWTETTWATSKVIFKPVDFFGCVINYSTFMGLNLKKVTISKCIAREVSFEEANLTQANCRFTDFMNSRFMHTNLTGADFTGAKNYAIAAGLNTLKKTKFSLPEAMSLLYNLDISLTEYGDEEK
jgi:fluoroquinolone resistance protein